MSINYLIRKKYVYIGNLISHSNIKTKRKFKSNLCYYYLKSEILNFYFRIKTTNSIIKIIYNKNGLDNFLIQSKNKNLTFITLKIKKVILSKIKKYLFYKI